jgi:4-hydroxybenzoate polyprenyltransferase
MAVGWLIVASRSDHGPAWRDRPGRRDRHYNVRHKRDPLGPLIMGICRGLVYCIAASAIAPVLTPAVFIAAVVMTAYVLSLTFVAKKLGPQAGVVIPILIAGISAVDAVVIAAAGGGVALVLMALVADAVTAARGADLTNCHR